MLAEIPIQPEDINRIALTRSKMKSNSKSTTPGSRQLLSPPLFSRGGLGGVDAFDPGLLCFCLMPLSFTLARLPSANHHRHSATFTPHCPDNAKNPDYTPLHKRHRPCNDDTRCSVNHDCTAPFLFLAMNPKRISISFLLLLCSNAGANTVCESPIRVLAFSRAENSSSLQLLHKVMANMGCDTELVYNAARQNRRLRLLQEGQVDIITEASDRPERRAYAWISIPYRVERTGIYILNETPGLDRSLTLDKILAQRLRTYLPTGWHGERFNLWRETMRLHNLGIDYDSSTEVIRDLSIKRIDVIIGIDYPAPSDWSQSPQIVRSGDWIYEEPVSFLLSKKRFDAEWVERFNHVLTGTLLNPD